MLLPTANLERKAHPVNSPIIEFDDDWIKINGVQFFYQKTAWSKQYQHLIHCNLGGAQQRFDGGEKLAEIGMHGDQQFGRLGDASLSRKKCSEQLRFTKVVLTDDS